MSLQIFKDFNDKIKNISSIIDTTIIVNNKVEFGEPINGPQINDYSNYETPKLIVNINGKDIQNSKGVKSRFVYNTKTKSNNNIIFVFSSKSQNTFDEICQNILEETQLIKDSL